MSLSTCMQSKAMAPAVWRERALMSEGRKPNDGHGGRSSKGGDDVNRGDKVCMRVVYVGGKGSVGW
jgi:hypothetical protein